MKNSELVHWPDILAIFLYKSTPLLISTYTMCIHTLLSLKDGFIKYW